jgi:hypothetical protein
VDYEAPESLEPLEKPSEVIEGKNRRSLHYASLRSG